MAVGNFEFYSQCLRRNVPFRVIVPNDGDTVDAEPMKTLMLLHGYNGGHSDWLWNSHILDIAQAYHLCVVMPAGENSFYLDGEATGRQYATYVGEELLQYVRKTFRLSQKREDTLVAGFSMGGFGAIHTACQFSQNFAGAIALSSALLIHGLGTMKPGDDNGIANYAYYQLMFGDLEKVQDSDANPEKLLGDLQAAGAELPRFYVACGEQDFLLHANRQFVEFLKEHGIEHCYHEGPGEHNFEYWNRHIGPGIQWFLKEKGAKSE